MRVWVTGANGLLGTALLKVLKEQAIAHVGSSREQVDITSLNAIASFCRSYGPFTHIINCAAYTAVDQAEVHQNEARRANALAPALLGLFAASAGMRLVHLSTDYVFDGNAALPYTEKEHVAPQTIYGVTKAEGEKRLAALLPEACIIRTSWLFGSGGKNFVSTLLNKMREQDEIRVVHDQRGKPTFISDLARVLTHALSWSGIYHVANTGETSWYLFAEAIRQEAQAQGIPIRCQRVLPIASTEFPTAARRPAYSVLDTTKAERRLGRSLPHWKEGLTTTLRQL